MARLPWRTLKILREQVASLRAQISNLESQLRTLDSHITENTKTTLKQAADEREQRLREATDSIVQFATTRIDEVQAGINELLLDRVGEIYADLTEKTNSRVMSTEESLVERLSTIEGRIDATRNDIDATRNDIDTTRNDISQHLSDLRRAFSALRHSTTTVPVQIAAGQVRGQEAQPVIDDVTYSMIEDRFRGSPDVIYERQCQYLPLVLGRVTEEYPLLDIGCGRGEWLRLMRDNGLHARGLDMNSAFVEECRSSGLSVSLGVVPDHFESLQDQTFGAITMFQVAEHLEFATLQTVIRESLRLLRPGGVFILEFPNIQTHSVGASTFWIDPTHPRPLHPQVVEFLIQNAGFTLQPSVYSSPILTLPELANLDPDTRSFLARLTEMVGGPGDVAVVGIA